MTDYTKTDFTKKQFQDFWGADGYYENFQFGVGIERVVEKTITPFYSNTKTALEVGCGGGVFTDRLIGHFKHLYAIDVIAKPNRFKWDDFTFIEVPNQDYTCHGIESNTIDYCFSYGVFCHLSDQALKEYFENVYRVLKKGGNFVFMISNFEKFTAGENCSSFKRGDLLPGGHFVQDDRTLDLLGDKWKIVSRDMIPEHRDLLIHLKK